MDAVDEIEVSYPGGDSVIYPGPIAVDQRVWVYEDGALEEGFSPPARGL